MDARDRPRSRYGRRGDADYDGRCRDRSRTGGRGDADYDGPGRGDADYDGPGETIAAATIIGKKTPVIIQRALPVATALYLTSASQIILTRGLLRSGPLALIANAVPKPNATRYTSLWSTFTISRTTAPSTTL